MVVTDFGRSCAHGSLTFSPDSTLLALVAPSGCVIADAVNGSVLLTSDRGGFGACFYWGGPNRRTLFVHHAENGLIPMDADLGAAGSPINPRFVEQRGRWSVGSRAPLAALPEDDYRARFRQLVEQRDPWSVGFRVPSVVFAEDGSCAVFRRVEERIESLCAVRKSGDGFAPDWSCFARDRNHNLFVPLFFLPGSEQFIYTAHRGTHRYQSGVVVLARAESGDPIIEIPAPSDLVGSAASGDWLALAPSNSPECHLYRTGGMSREPLVVASRNRGWLYGVAFHPSGQLFTAVGNDGEVPLFDTTNWNLATNFDWKLGPLQCVAFSPDGALAAAGSEWGRVVVWDVDV